MKRYSALLLSLALTLCLCACGKQAQPTYLPPVIPLEILPEAGQPEGYALDAREYVEELVSDDGAALGSIQLSLPKVESLPQIDAYYQVVFDDLVRITQDNWKQTEVQLESARKQGGELPYVFCFADLKVACNDGKTLSFLRRIHECWSTEEEDLLFAETFDCASQGRMQLGDLFEAPEEEYLPRLTQLTEQAMASTKDLTIGEIDPLNFTVSEDGRLTLVANRHRAVDLNLADLNDLLKEQWKVQ